MNYPKLRNGQVTAMILLKQFCSALDPLDPSRAIGILREFPFLVFYRNEYGFTAIHEAALRRCDTVEMYDTWLACGGEPNPVTDWGASLHALAWEPEVKGRIIRQRAQASTYELACDIITKETIYYENNQSFPKNSEEIAENRLSEVLPYQERLHQQRGRYGDTLLHLAASKGHVGIVRKLLEDGAAVNARNYRGETVLSHTAPNPRDPKWTSVEKVWGRGGGAAKSSVRA